ncbi:MAG: aminotransferase class V-fold PLP-dependent enzyme [Actinomycetota bacterium]|nr:aminotransferase class V-fold PLP-dependent enzyme [Actinomycetota bacterium]
MTVEDARARFPVLERYAYLNAGSVGPMAQSTFDAMVDAGRAELGPRGGIEAFTEIIAARERLRGILGAFIGVDGERVALTTSTSEGCRVVVAGLDLGADDEIVTTDAEHFGLLGPVHASGARVRVARVRDRHPSEALTAVLAEVGPRTRLIALSHVLWVNGHVIPLAELKEATDVPLLVDGAQSVGAIPVDAEPYDFYTVSGQKWLCGPTPTGALYVRDPERLRVAGPSYFSQASYERDGAFVPREGAARFEQNWVPAAFIAGLEAALAAVPEWAFERARAVTDLCREQLLEAGLDVVTEPGQGTLVAVRWAGDPAEATKRLYEEDVVVRDLPGTGLIRASCGYWTSEEDVARLVEALRRLAA